MANTTNKLIDVLKRFDDFDWRGWAGATAFRARSQQAFKRMEKDPSKADPYIADMQIAGWPGVDPLSDDSQTCVVIVDQEGIAITHCGEVHNGGEVSMLYLGGGLDLLDVLRQMTVGMDFATLTDVLGFCKN